MCKAEGRVTEAVEVDHIVPLAMGGNGDESNLQPLCHDHHAAKTAQENAALNGRDDSVVAVY
jgi:5-methylcytosine-specific restriction protein A